MSSTSQLKFALALVFTVGITAATGQPECSSDAFAVYYGNDTTACYQALPAKPTAAEFCSIDACVSYAKSLAEAVTTECTIGSINAKAFLYAVRNCTASSTMTYVGTPVPECGSDVVVSISNKDAKICTDSLQADLKTDFCSIPTCRALAEAFAKTVETDCVINFNGSYISPLDLPECDSNPQSQQLPTKRTITIVLVVVGSVVVVVIVAMLFRLKHRQHKGNNDDSYTEVRDAPFPEGDALLLYKLPYRSIEFGQVISRGAYGEVLYARYKGEDVAVKRLLPARRIDADDIHSFVQEIQLTASLNHESVVRFIGAGWVDGKTLCMVSEFMPGGDLRGLLVKYNESGHPHGHDDYKLRIAIQVAHAMTYLHSLDPPIVHRDLKSKNTLLTASGDAKIIDFGVSCERQDFTMTMGVGTSLWMAPEVMKGEKYDESADVFSFGVILSELDTHQLPYDHAREMLTDGKMTRPLLQQLISQGRLKPRFTDVANPAIVELARDCLELSRKSRPTAFEVVKRIHECNEFDFALTDFTRTALDRAYYSVETAKSKRRHAFGSLELRRETEESTCTSP